MNEDQAIEMINLLDQINENLKKVVENTGHLDSFYERPLDEILNNIESIKQSMP